MRACVRACVRVCVLACVCECVRAADCVDHQCALGWSREWACVGWNACLRSCSRGTLRAAHRGVCVAGRGIGGCAEAGFHAHRMLRGVSGRGWVWQASVQAARCGTTVAVGQALVLGWVRPHVTASCRAWRAQGVRALTAVLVRVTGTTVVCSRVWQAHVVSSGRRRRAWRAQGRGKLSERHVDAAGRGEYRPCERSPQRHSARAYVPPPGPGEGGGPQ